MMECYKCTKSGVELIYMVVEYDFKLGASVAKCPKCGHEEIIGFGKI